MFGRRTATATLDRAEDYPDDFAALYVPERVAERETVESLLLSRGVITREQLEKAENARRTAPGRTVAQLLIEHEAAAEHDVLAALAETLDLPFERPEKDALDPDAFALLPAEFLSKNALLPLRLVNGTLHLGTADPTNVFLLDEARRRAGRDVRPVVVPSADIARIGEQMRGATDGGMAVEDIIADMAEDDVQVVEQVDDSVADLEKMGSESPVIRFVNYLIADAIKQGASDIHIEPKERKLKVRYRIDGILFEAMSPPHTMQAAVVSRLKIMANLDISERRLPQDGRIRAVVQGRQIDLRMSTLPTAHGEKTVIRILDNRSINVPLEALGFGEAALNIWREQIDMPHGILLVTGPTGSGKTTTLYSSLRCMDGEKLNISTVEDPIEYHLPAANQVQVHERIGMTFSAALRSLLRQDPDVVMLGEIRDAETARIAVQASLTGHMVLSTLHTNDAPASITRLINIGVEPYLISAAVNAILAQRLVRKICQHCKTPFAPTAEAAEYLEKQGLPSGETYRGAGCEKCRKTGYSGRLGLYELLVMTDELRDLVTGNPDVTQLRRLCRERGLVTLRDDGVEKVKQGLTTVDEVLRVTEGS